MNFIAHIHLSGEDAPLLVGNYIADLIRQADVAGLPEEIQRGVMLHRMIDTYTDQHDVNRDALERIYPFHHKYSPVLLDIYYDYFLIKHWSTFSSSPFEDVCAFAYDSLAQYLPAIPIRTQPRIEHLLERRWLETAYGTFNGLEKTFYFLKKRMSQPDIINRATETLMKHEAELETAFLTFYPDLIQEVKSFSW